MPPAAMLPGIAKGCGNASGWRKHYVTIREHPAQILIRCERPRELACKMMESEHTLEVRIHNDERGLLIKTRDADRFYLMLNHIALNGVEIESVAPADRS